MSLSGVCANDADTEILESNITENDMQAIPSDDDNFANADNTDNSLICINGEENSQNSNSEKNRFSGLDIDTQMIYKIPMIDGTVIMGDTLDSLQKDIDDTPARSTLNVNASLKKNSNENKIITINKDITIDGNGHSIDFGACKNCYIDISAGQVILKNIKFLNGFNDKSDKGGALYIHNTAKVTIINCSFDDNFARKAGGAIYCDNKNKLSIYDCTFDNNKADKEKGGAVYSKGNIIISNTVLSGNHAKEDGGAVFCEGKVNVGHCLFESNTATEKSDFQNYGGAICAKGDLTIFNSTFKDNKADDYGGAAYSYASITVNDTASTKSFFIKNNAADEHGGALYAKGNVAIQNALFSGNIADGDGGAIYSESEVCIKNSIIKNNKAGGKAGAVWAKSKISVKGCTLNQNFDSKSQMNPFYSKNGKIEIDNDNSKSMNSKMTFDKLSSVSLNKDTVNFWISNSNELKKLFEFISSKDPSWNIINITLAPNTVFNADYSTFNIEQTGYCIRFAGESIIFNGNPGSVIVGKNHKNNFIYACQDTNVFFLNMNLECFNHCIVNLGNMICINSSFCDNEFHIDKREKDKPRYEIFGGVMVNYNTAIFENCTFVGNKAVYDGDKHGCWGSILFAESYSQTFLVNCLYYNSGDDCFYADKYSSIAVIQDHELGKEFKDCRIAPEASLSAIAYSAYKNTMGYTCVINCSNVDQLKNALYIVNSFLPGLSIVINLKPGVYEIPEKWIKDTKVLRSLDWRDEIYHPSVIEKANKNWDIIDKFVLDVGVVPITINGNGATIKVSNLKDSGFMCFADVAYGGQLTLNNLKLSNFNHVFRSVGTIYAINCTFENNKHYCGKPILWGFKSTTYFINCTLKPVDGRCADSNIFTIETDSYVKFENCDFDFSNGGKNIGNCKDSAVECPSSLKNKIWFNGGSTCYNTDEVVINESKVNGHEFIFLVQIVSKNYDDRLTDLIKKSSPKSIVLNITCDCEIDLKKLNFKGSIIVNGNNYNVKFISDDREAIVINKLTALTINNVTFSQYAFSIFDNKGTLNIINCNFINNTCEYLINNQGECNIINCTFIGNNNKNIIYNKGSLDIECCIFDNNSYTNKGLIYNEGGSVSGINSAFNKVDNVICNHATPNCVFINCSNYTKAFSEIVHKKMPVWKKYLIRGSLMVGLFVLSVLTAHAISKNFACSPIINIAVGGIMSLGFACLDDYIIGGYENDYSSRSSIFKMYLCIGIGGAIIGNVWGSSAYYAPYIEKCGYDPLKLGGIDGQSYRLPLDDLEMKIIADDLSISYLPENTADASASGLGLFSCPQTLNIVSYSI